MGRQRNMAPPMIPGSQYVRSLGSGGFADILLYEADFPRRPVAVKVMHNEVNDPEQIALFKREADALAKVSAHPSILSIYSASISSDGRPYLVLEYCPGSLQSSYRKRPMELARVLDLGVRVASALESCHRSGILHRDIKPSNLLINKFGNVVLADFGIVGSLAPNAGQDLFALSIPWSAPEVIDERSTGTVASEIWSLSATLYALLSGRGPFERSGVGKNDDEQISARIRKARYTPIGRMDVPAQLEAILEQGMSKNPARRQDSAYAFAEQLRSIQQYLNLPPTDLVIAGGPEQYLLPHESPYAPKVPLPGGRGDTGMAQAVQSGSDSWKSGAEPWQHGATPSDTDLWQPADRPGQGGEGGGYAPSAMVTGRGGPVRSKVEVESKRRRAQQQRRPQSITSGRGTRSTSSGIPRSGSDGIGWGTVLVIVLIVVVLTAAAVVGIMAWVGA